MTIIYNKHLVKLLKLLPEGGARRDLQEGTQPVIVEAETRSRRGQPKSPRGRHLAGWKASGEAAAQRRTHTQNLFWIFQPLIS
jgi:hypothetical protein